MMQGKKDHKILVVDDEPDILELLEYNLKKEGYSVATASNGIDAIELAKSFQPKLILLDIMMPKQDGVETCRLLKEDASTKNIFIIFLTARAEEYSEVAAFDAGADDYLVKPIKPRALMSRINAYFRRDEHKKTAKKQIVIRDLVIDRGGFFVKVGDKEVVLPKKEFELLYFLAKHPNQVYSRDELLKNIWGVDVYVLARTVDVHIRKIREKIGEGYLMTVKGVGYKFTLDE